MTAGVALGTVNVLANASLLGPWSGHLSKIVGNDWAWLVACFLPGCGLLASLTRRGGALGVVAAAVVPGYVAWNAITIHRWMDQPAPVDPQMLDVVRVLWPAATIATIGVVLGTGIREVRRRPTAHVPVSPE